VKKLLRHGLRVRSERRASLWRRHDLRLRDGDGIIGSASSAALLREASDSTLAGRAIDGDMAAFEVIVRRHSGLMRAHAIRLLGSNSESDDVVQEAFIAAWQQLPELRNPAALKSWLMRIVSFGCMDRIRARRDAANIDDHEVADSEALTPEAVVTAASRNQALALVLKKLPPPQGQVWELKQSGGLSYEEIGEVLGLPPSTVRGALSRARKTIIQEMEVWR